MVILLGLIELPIEKAIAMEGDVAWRRDKESNGRHADGT